MVKWIATEIASRATLLFCLNHTRSDSSMSEISDEEVDYGSSDIVGNPNIYLDYAWSKPGNYSQD
jgi:hypothetical protein